MIAIAIAAIGFFAFRSHPTTGQSARSAALRSEVVPAWTPYVRAEHHRRWLKTQTTHGLSDELMLGLFPAIKRIDGDALGQYLSDLTAYPELIDRGLRILVEEHISNVALLRAHTAWLGALHANYKRWPDEADEAMAVTETFDQRVILLFYQQLLDPSRVDRTRALLASLARTASP